MTNVQVTNRTARVLRPQDGMERIFRKATQDLAKKHAFARSLVNTGRMAVANPYSRSPLSAADLPASHSVQNVEFAWSDGSVGQLNQLLHWARGWPLLLLWVDSKEAGQLVSSGQLARLRLHTRMVCVASHVQDSPARETVVDPAKRLAQACGLRSPAWALIRPDSYLASSGEQASVAAISQALSRLREPA